MYEKIVKALIAMVVILIVILSLIYGVSKSEFNNIKKYDEKDSIRSVLKEKIAKRRYYTTEVKITDGDMASLGDFTLNISGNRKLTANISLKFKNNKNNSWIGGESVESEILKKGDVLRSAVIHTMFESKNTTVSNQRMKRELVKSMNNYLIEGEVEEVYFNKFIIQ